MDEKRSNVNEKSIIAECSCGEGILAELASIARREDIPAVDYNQKIDQWNSYQALLDKIDGKCSLTKGDVQLRRNIKHNAKIFDYTTAAFLSFTGLVALFMYLEGITSNNTYLVIASLVPLALVGWQAFIRLHPPSFVHFTCRPALHIDEYTFMNKTIKGISKVRRDPVVNLPPLEMSIPRAWLAQQSMLDFMQSLADIQESENRRKDE
jgi:hypothetical protein